MRVVPVSKIAVRPVRPSEMPLTETVSINPSQNPCLLTLGNSVRDPVNLVEL
jgi:hypothetical protein